MIAPEFSALAARDAPAFTRQAAGTIDSSRAAARADAQLAAIRQLTGVLEIPAQTAAAIDQPVSAARLDDPQAAIGQLNFLEAPFPAFRLVPTAKLAIDNPRTTAIFDRTEPRRRASGYCPVAPIITIGCSFCDDPKDRKTCKGAGNVVPVGTCSGGNRRKRNSQSSGGGKGEIGKSGHIGTPKGWLCRKRGKPAVDANKMRARWLDAQYRRPDIGYQALNTSMLLIFKPRHRSVTP